MSRYGIKEVFRTVQGEGARAGTSAVFVRFTGCNLWDGHHLHRESGAGPCAQWCDTDFFKGVPMVLDDLLGLMHDEWTVELPSTVKIRPPHNERWCVLTGGEPAQQLDSALVVALNKAGWRIAVETNGTIDNDHLYTCDHVCLSPKKGTDWINALRAAHEVKVVLPGAALGAEGWTEEELQGIEELVSSEVGLYVQPQDPVLPGPDLASLLKGGIEPSERVILDAAFAQSVSACIAHVANNPRWRLSLQQHKFIGLP